MADSEIVRYIRENLSNGIGMEDIKSSLRQSGWSEDKISEGVAEVQGGSPRPGPVAEAVPASPQKAGKDGKKESHTKLIVALIIFCILFILFLYVAMSIVSDFNEMFPEAGNMLLINTQGSG